MYTIPSGKIDIERYAVVVLVTPSHTNTHNRSTADIWFEYLVQMQSTATQNTYIQWDGEKREKGRERVSEKERDPNECASHICVFPIVPFARKTVFSQAIAFGSVLSVFLMLFVVVVAFVDVADGSLAVVVPFHPESNENGSVCVRDMHECYCQRGIRRICVFSSSFFFISICSLRLHVHHFCPALEFSSRSM